MIKTICAVPCPPRWAQTGRHIACLRGPLPYQAIPPPVTRQRNRTILAKTTTTCIHTLMVNILVIMEPDHTGFVRSQVVSLEEEIISLVNGHFSP